VNIREPKSDEEKWREQKAYARQLADQAELQRRHDAKPKLALNKWHFPLRRSDDGTENVADRAAINAKKGQVEALGFECREHISWTNASCTLEAV
jgi:hypothetical protein